MNDTIQQALHGYSRGHRLLSCSMEFPQSVLRKMLYLSDLSGTYRAEGFEQYLTAYPLPEISMFALAQTWDAPEMERPGCVFTHTLLLSYSDLAQIPDLSALLPLFCRPTKGEAGQPYQAPLPIPLALPARRLDRKKVRSLLDALYEHDDQNIVIAANRSDDWQAVLFAAWSQMWPRLRRQFSFSTGSLGSRTIDGEPFALQIIPSRWQPRMERDFPEVVWLHDDTEPKSTTRWLSSLVEDCAVAETTELRTFLRHQGADLPPRRSLLPLLWRIWDWQRPSVEAATEPRRISELLRAISDFFPHAEEAIRLKTELLGTRSQHSDSERALLVALGTTPSPQAFEQLGPTCTERVRALWYSDQNAAWGVVRALFEGQRNVIGDLMLQAIGDRLVSKDISFLATKYPEILHRWLPSHPEWLTQPDLWKQPQAQQKRMLEWVVQHRQHLAERLSDTLDAFITHGSSLLAPDAAQAFGPALVDNLLALLAAGKLPWPLTEPWLDVLRRNQTQVLRWLARGNRSGKFLAELVPLLNPSALSDGGILLSAQASDLLSAAEQADASTRQILHAIRCYLGLNIQHEQGFEFLYKSFLITYNSVRSATLPGIWSQHILDNIPRMKAIRPTHTEDKLLIALWSNFSEGRWDLGHLFRILNDRNILTQFVGLLRYSDEGNSLKMLRKYSKRHPEKLTNEQRDVLNDQSLKEWLQKIFGGSPIEED